jgi:adenylyltransferase/sulfurtransferase
LVQQIDVRELQRKLAAGEPVYLIDVRQPWEHETVALPDSLLIPLGELFARSDEIKPPAGALVVAYCHHGIRSLSAAALLEQLGFRPAASLGGGIDAWSREVDPSMPRYG